MLDLTWLQDHWQKFLVVLLVVGSYQVGSYRAFSSMAEVDDRAVPMLVRCLDSLEAAVALLQQ